MVLEIFDMCRDFDVSAIESNTHVQGPPGVTHQRPHATIWACASGRVARDSVEGQSHGPFAANVISLLSIGHDLSVPELYDSLHQALASQTKNESNGKYPQLAALTQVGPLNDRRGLFVSEAWQCALSVPKLHCFIN